MKKLGWSMLLMLMSSTAWGCELSVQEGWLRLPPPMSDTAAAYMVLKNGCAETKVIKRVTSPAAKMVMMHDADMRGISDWTLAPQQSVAFKPLEKHIMLMGLKQAFHVGGTIPFTIYFKDGSEQGVDVVVKDMRMDGHRM